MAMARPSENLCGHTDQLSQALFLGQAKRCPYAGHSCSMHASWTIRNRHLDPKEEAKKVGSVDEQPNPETGLAHPGVKSRRVECLVKQRPVKSNEGGR